MEAWAVAHRNGGQAGVDGGRDIEAWGLEK